VQVSVTEFRGAVGGERLGLVAKAQPGVATPWGFAFRHGLPVAKDPPEIPEAARLSL